MAYGQKMTVKMQSQITKALNTQLSETEVKKKADGMWNHLTFFVYVHTRRLDDSENMLKNQMMSSVKYCGAAYIMLAGGGGGGNGGNDDDAICKWRIFSPVCGYDLFWYTHTHMYAYDLNLPQIDTNYYDGVFVSN